MTDADGRTVSKRRERAKPEVVKLGKREVITSGHWNDELVAKYVMDNSHMRWITIGELAKFAWSNSTLANKERARRYLSKLWLYLLTHEGRLLVVETDPKHRNRAQAVKIYDPTSLQERQALQVKLQKMEQRGEMTKERYLMALGLLLPPEPDAVA